jgi:c-di-GMP-binding flagellar brake protein YcgR
MLQSLLLSRDAKTVRLMARGFKDLEVEFESFPDSDSFLIRALETRYDAIVLDDDVENAHVILEQILGFATCTKAVRIVLADHNAAIHNIFKTSTQIVLYKPLSPERLRQGLRAVRNLMARERRQGAKRISAMVPARISPRHSRGEAIQVLLADISDSGAAIRYENGDLPDTSALKLEFALPGNPDRIHCLAELVWRDYQGSGGVRFVDMPNFARQQLTEWLSETEKLSQQADSAHA